MRPTKSNPSRPTRTAGAKSLRTAVRTIILSIPLMFIVGTLLVLAQPQERLDLSSPVSADLRAETDVLPATDSLPEADLLSSPNSAVAIPARPAQDLLSTADTASGNQPNGLRHAPPPQGLDTKASSADPVQTALLTSDRFPQSDIRTDHAPPLVGSATSPLKRTPLPIDATPANSADQLATEAHLVPDARLLDPFGDLKPDHGDPLNPEFRFFDPNDNAPLQQDSPGIILGQIERDADDQLETDPRFNEQLANQSRTRPGNYVVQFGALNNRSKSRSNHYAATLSNEARAGSSGASETMNVSDLNRIESQLNGINRRVELVAQAQLQQMQSEQLKYLKDLNQQLEDLKKRATKAVESANQPPEATSDTSPAGTNTSGQPANSIQNANTPAASGTTGTTGTARANPPVLRIEPSTGGSKAISAEQRFSLQIEDGTEITKVLEMLGQLSGHNVLVSSGVKGVVSANLQNVTVEEALDGLLKVRDFAYEKDTNFIYVMTLDEVAAKKKEARKVISKIYRPNYITAKELQSLITPLLTQNIGISAVSNPAEQGIAADPSAAGGDSLSQQDALLVQDFDDVIERVDEIVDEMDVPPAQVVIEALILEVNLTDEMALGVNFALLGDNNKNFSVVGDGASLNSAVGFPQNFNSVRGVGKFLAGDALGLKYGFIQGDVSAFIDALETITEVNMVAAPTIRVLNKQKAQLIIGQKLAYTETTTNGNTTQTNVNFLDVGTKLFVRPYVAPDGYVRMEVHPERSSGSIDSRNLPNTTTAEVTTNVMIRDGATIIIGGLISEDVTESTSGVPLLSSLPGVGGFFRNRTDKLTRTELIVLLTPRIVNQSQSATRGVAAREEQLERARSFKNTMTPALRGRMANSHFDLAQRAFEQNDHIRASHHIDQAARLSPNNLQVQRLKKLIQSQIPPRNWFPSAHPAPIQIFDSPPPPRRTGLAVPPSPKPSRRAAVARHGSPTTSTRLR